MFFFSKAGFVLLYKYVPAMRFKASARSSPPGFPLLSGLDGQVFRSVRGFSAGQLRKFRGELHPIRHPETPARPVGRVFQDLFTALVYLVFKPYKIYKMPVNKHSSKKF
jgi:hypothetical protein